MLGLMVILGCVLAIGAQAESALSTNAARYVEAEPLEIEFNQLTALCMDADGNLLAGDGPAGVIKVIGPDGKLVRSLRAGLSPQAIDIGPDGSIYCGGHGEVVKLDADGSVVGRATLAREEAAAPRRARRGRSRGPGVSGLAVGASNVFVTVGSGWSLRAKATLVRLDLALGSERVLVQGLRGCCQRCDIAAWKGGVLVAENSAHRVVHFDRDGEQQGAWGSRGRTDAEGFGSCCNPMNLYLHGKGALYTAESGLGRIKRYSPEGVFLGVVGIVGTRKFANAGGVAASCSNIALAVSPDEARVFVMDYGKNLIRVLERR